MISSSLEKIEIFLRDSYTWYENETNKGRVLLPIENRYQEALVYKMRVQPRKKNLNAGQTPSRKVTLKKPRDPESDRESDSDTTKSKEDILN